MTQFPTRSRTTKPRIRWVGSGHSAPRGHQTALLLDRRSTPRSSQQGRHAVRDAVGTREVIKQIRRSYWLPYPFQPPQSGHSQLMLLQVRPQVFSSMQF